MTNLDYARICYESYRNYMWIKGDKSLFPWMQVSKHDQHIYSNLVKSIFKQFSTGNMEPALYKPENQVQNELYYSILRVFWDLHVLKIKNKIA